MEKVENKHFFILALVCVIFSEATMQRCFLSWVLLNNKRNLWKISAKGKKEVIFSNVAGPFVSLTKTLYLTGFCSELASFLGISLSSCLCVFLYGYVYIVFMMLKWMALWRYAVLFCFCHVKRRVHLFICLLIYVITVHCSIGIAMVQSHNQHKVWIKAFQIFQKKFIRRENFFA